MLQKHIQATGTGRTRAPPAHTKVHKERTAHAILPHGAQAGKHRTQHTLTLHLHLQEKSTVNRRTAAVQCFRRNASLSLPVRSRRPVTRPQIARWWYQCVAIYKLLAVKCLLTRLPVS